MRTCGWWRSIWKPKTLCGVRDGFVRFGELVRLSGGLLHIQKPCMCIFRGVWCGCSRICGNLCPFLPWWNLEGSFCVGENLGFTLSWNFGVLSGVYGNLKGSFKREKTSVCGAVGNFGVLFGRYGNFGVVILGVWKLGTLAHTKLSVCIRGLCGTSWILRVWWNFGRVRWWYSVVGWSCVVGRCVVGRCVWWSFFFSAFRETRWLLWGIETYVLRFVYIFRSVGGVLSVW